MLAGSQAEGGEQLTAARKLLLAGRYDEAADKFAEKKTIAEDPVAAALGVAHCRTAQGQLTEAVETLTKARAAHPKAASLPAALAQLAFDRGDHKAAQDLVTTALALDKQELTARWIQAELYRTSGDIKAANQACGWFVDYYNDAKEVTDPDVVRTIGLAAAQFARWNRLGDQFTFLVNDLYPEALERQAEYWPAHYESGRLFLEKYNQAEAAKAFSAALAINANSADVHAALAELALQNFDMEKAQQSIRHALAIHPKHLGATLVQADLHFSNFEPDRAAEVLEAAQKINPVDEDLLGRLAAAYGMLDALPDDLSGTRMGAIVDAVKARNPHCGQFYVALGESLDKCRKYPAAAHFFRAAVAAMPEHAGARGELGMIEMRLGEEDAARKTLAESFEIDPFNVRVSNSIKVLEVLDGYETLETEHFIIRYDGEKDKLLAKYAARYLEQVHAELCRRLGYEPKEKSLFEIFNQAKNTDGHGWFSARMVGLPAIHTIGACAGKMVALTSPNSMKQRFNWARVLKHEFVHVINLQQTRFNIPHWFTEALAVLNEEQPRPAEWDAMLARRVPAGKVFNLDSINLAFMRPATSEDWQMAYCQAEIYAEYMLEKYGDDALAKMLSAYHDNLNTTASLARSFGVKQEDFERGYSEHLAAIVAKLAPAAPSTTKSFSTLQKEVAAAPDDVDLAAQLALAYLDRNQFPKAGELTDKVLKKSPKHPLATYVKAKLLMVVGENQRAYEMIEAVLDKQSPQLEVLKLLAGLKFKAEDYPAAEELFVLGQKHDAANLAWTKSLAMVHIKTGDKAKLAAVLKRLADASPDDLVIRKKLAQLAADAGDHVATEQWAVESLQIDVTDLASHKLLATALASQEKHAAAADEYELAAELAPDDADLQLGLVESCVKAGQKERARAPLAALLRLKPDHPRARELQETLKP